MSITMSHVKSLMEHALWGHLATTDGVRVGVRPMAAWAWIEGELWCGSARATEKVDQLGAVADAEYCFITPAAAHVRIGGPTRVSEAAEDKARLYAAVPSLADHTRGPDDPELVVLRMRPNRVRYMPTPTDPYSEVKL